MLVGVHVEEYPNSAPASPLVSVRIQTYRHVNYIAECLDRVLEQIAEFEYEVLVGEDDSDDGTREICLQYARRYPDKIRLFLHTRSNVVYIDGKPSGKFNFLYCLAQARGKYIALCDGDDYWNDRYKLQKQVEFLEREKGVVLSYHGAVRVDENGIDLNGGRPKKKRINGPPRTGDLTTRSGSMSMSSVMFRNVLEAREFPREFIRTPGGDRFLFSLLGLYGQAGYQGDEINPVARRVHREGMWSGKSRGEQLRHSMITRYWLAKFYSHRNLKEQADHFLKHYHQFQLKLLETSLERGEYREALRTLGYYLTSGLLTWRQSARNCLVLARGIRKGVSRGVHGAT